MKIYNPYIRIGIDLKVSFNCLTTVDAFLVDASSRCASRVVTGRSLGRRAVGLDKGSLIVVDVLFQDDGKGERREEVPLAVVEFAHKFHPEK